MTVVARDKKTGFTKWTAEVQCIAQSGYIIVFIDRHGDEIAKWQPDEIYEVLA